MGRIKRGLKRAEHDLAGLRPGTNWITTAGGLLAAVGAAAPFLPPPYNGYAMAATAVGGAIVGVSARQANVTSAEMKKDAPK